MARKTYTRLEYQGMFANLLVLTIIAIGSVRIVRVFFEEGFKKTAEVSTWDKNDAWHMLSNDSMWMRDQVNGTGTKAISNASSFWIPPEEWRRRCMATNGAPIVACSYFQYEQYPSFMSFFFVIYFIFVLVMTALQILGFYRVGVLLNKCRTGGGPGFTQVNAVLMTLLLSRLWSGFLFTDWYLLWGSGAGLVNSFGSGKMYLGAGWNDSPLPTPKELLDDTSGLRSSIMWSADTWPEYPFSVYGLLQISSEKLYHFSSVVNGCFGTCPFYSDIVYFMMIADKVYRTQMLMWSQDLASTTSAYPGLVFEPVIPWYRFSAWRTMYKSNGPFLFMYVLIITSLALPWTVRIELEQMPGLSYETEEDGRREMAAWWGTVQGLTRVSCFMFIVQWLVMALWYPATIGRKKRIGEKIGVSEAFKARTRLVENTITQIKWIFAFLIICNFVLLPSGLMMMYYGTTTEFPTLTDGVFGVAGGTSSRLLAAPLLRCVYYCAFLVLFIGGFTKGLAFVHAANISSSKHAAVSSTLSDFRHPQAWIHEDRPQTS